MADGTLVMDVLALQRQADDQMDFEQVFERWHAEIHAWLLGMTRDVHDADDLFQQVFLKVHRHLAGFQGDQASLRAWLYAIARNVVHDHWRKQKRRPRIVEPEEQLDPQPGPQQRNEAGELGHWLAGMVTELSPKLRECYVLRIEQELSFSEMETIIGEPADRLMGRTYLALKQLRAAYNRRYGHDQ